MLFHIGGRVGLLYSPAPWVIREKERDHLATEWLELGGEGREWGPFISCPSPATPTGAGSGPQGEGVPFPAPPPAAEWPEMGEVGWNRAPSHHRPNLVPPNNPSRVAGWGMGEGAFPASSLSALAIQQPTAL